MTDFEKIKKRYEDNYAPACPDAVQNYIFALEVARIRAEARVQELEAELEEAYQSDAPLCY